MNIIKKQFSTKISNKIFLSTVFIILFILIIQWVTLSFVLNDAQFILEDRNLKKDFTTFLEDIKTNRYDYEYIELASQGYFENTDNPILIFDENDYVLNESVFKYNFSNFILTSDGIQYNVLIDNNNIPSLIKTNDRLSLYKVSKSYYILLDAIGPDEFENTDLSEYPRIFSITNVSVDNMFIKDYSYSIVFLYSDFLEQNKRNFSTQPYQKFEEDYSDVISKNIYYAAKFEIDNLSYSVITSNTIVALDKQIGYINTINLYIFIFGIILAIIISRFFSKTLSKPMIQLSESAKDMSTLNFSNKISLNRNDELGSLSKSLNHLSTQLENNLNTLQAQNKELQINNTLLTKEEKRAKDLIHNLSHELNTPLGIISGFTEILTDGINDKEPLYYYDSINFELERMKILINDMLDLSMLENGSYKLDFEKINITDIIKSCLFNYTNTFDKKNIKIVTNYYNASVVGNNKKIYQVIDNFISNASKYTTVKGTFEISYLCKNNQIYFMFKNTSDLNEDNLERLWEKFYRTEKENSRQSVGSGIGLSIVKEILLLHESDFGIKKHVDSIEFYFSLKSHF